jgi:PAS domain S-box-containing protein
MKYQNIISKTFFKKAWKSFAILTIGIALTFMVAHYTKKSAETQAKYKFGLVCNEIKTKIISRLNTQSLLLQTGSSFISAFDTVTRDDWNFFVENSKISQNILGYQGIGFNIIVPKKDIKQHIQRIRKDYFPEYTIRPTGDRELYTSIIYLEPFSIRNKRAIGFDTYSEPIRRRAMEHARDFNLSTLTEKLFLVQENQMNKQAGVIMYTPVYKRNLPTNTIDERRNAIIGWVSCPYRMNNLMINILGHWDLNDKSKIHLKIYDNDSISQSSLLFDSQSNDTTVHSGLWEQTITVPVVFNNKKWTLQFSQSNQHFSFSENKGAIVLISGLIISLLLFSLSLALFNTQLQAQQIAEKLTLELKESELRYKRITNGLNDYIYTVTVKNKKAIETIHSDACAVITGYTPKEFAQNPNLWINMVIAEERELVAGKLLKMLDGKDITTIEHRIICKNGRIRWISDTLIPKYDLDGNFISYDGIIKDITERKQAEQLLKEKNEEIAIQNNEYASVNEELNKLISDLSLANNELTSTREDVEMSNIKLLKLNADKNRFISILGHDLKSPFNTILGFLNLLIKNVRKYDIDKIENQINMINTSAKNTYSLLEDILMWVRANSGKIPYKPQKLIFATICNEVIATMKLTANTKNIEINCFANNDLIILADNDMLKTVLRNLISNAIKFTNTGGTITINAEQNPSEITVSVADNGVGMTPAEINKLFDVAQIHTTSGTANESGTGLGLLLCKEFVEKHGGKIWVESEPGNLPEGQGLPADRLGKEGGSNFTFTLPQSE